MPTTNRPPDGDTGKPEPTDKPISPERASPSKGAQDANRDKTQPEHQKRIERFIER